MKQVYNYRKFATFFYFFSTFCFYFFFMIYPAFLISERFKLRILVGSFALIAVMFGRFVPEYLNRKIELSKEYCKFTSFRVKKVVKPVTITTHYKDISYIKIKPFPFIGFRSVNIKISHYGKIIEISPYYTNRIELFSTLCENVQQYNPDAEIDPRLISYLERKKSK